MAATVDRAVAKLRDSTAELLDHLAEATDDPRFRQGAGILRGRRAGRKPVDDRAALALARSLLDAGVKSQRQACQIAAQMYARDYQVDSMRDRLRRKLAKN